jgi:hypothetical protein
MSAAERLGGACRTRIGTPARLAHLTSQRRVTIAGTQIYFSAACRPVVTST